MRTALPRSPSAAWLGLIALPFPWPSPYAPNTPGRENAAIGRPSIQTSVFGAPRNTSPGCFAAAEGGSVDAPGSSPPIEGAAGCRSDCLPSPGPSQRSPCHHRCRGLWRDGTRVPGQRACRPSRRFWAGRHALPDMRVPFLPVPMPARGRSQRPSRSPGAHDVVLARPSRRRPALSFLLRHVPRGCLVRFVTRSAPRRPSPSRPTSASRSGMAGIIGRPPGR